METTTWLGYNFSVHPVTADWPGESGLYIFAALATNRLVIPQWCAVYVGEARNFATRLPNHERWAEAVRLGTTHVHLRIEYDLALRLVLEKNLIQRYQPPLNVQHR